MNACDAVGFNLTCPEGRLGKGCFRDRWCSVRGMRLFPEGRERLFKGIFFGIAGDVGTGGFKLSAEGLKLFVREFKEVKSGIDSVSGENGEERSRHEEKGVNNFIRRKKGGEESACLFIHL